MDGLTQPGALIQRDHYPDNLLERLEALERRLAALERLLQNVNLKVSGSHLLWWDGSAWQQLD